MSRRGGGWDEEPEYDIDPDMEDYEHYEHYDDDEEEAGSGRRRTLILLSIVALLAVFAGVMLLAYRQGSQEGVKGGPPILRADGSPTKVPPENPGGKTFPHQDAEVYSRIAGEQARARDEGEQLLPPAEEPLAIEDPSPIRPDDQAALDRMAQALEGNPLDMPFPNVPEEPVQVAPVQPEPTPAVPEVAVAPAQSIPATTATTPSGSGGYVVQLAALRDEASARATFDRLRKAHPGLLGGMSLDIQRADLGDKGIYYRARAGYLDKAAADALCEKLQAAGQGCIVRER